MLKKVSLVTSKFSNAYRSKRKLRENISSIFQGHIETPSKTPSENITLRSRKKSLYLKFEYFTLIQMYLLIFFCQSLMSNTKVMIFFEVVNNLVTKSCIQRYFFLLFWCEFNEPKVTQFVIFLLILQHNSKSTIRTSIQFELFEKNNFLFIDLYCTVR